MVRTKVPLKFERTHGTTDVPAGATLREALAEIRKVNFGDVGYVPDVELDDGTFIYVPMGGGIAERFRVEKEPEHKVIGIRKYAL